MFQEKRLDSCENAARSSLILVNAILDVLIKKEALLPRIMEAPLAVFKQKSIDPRALLSTNTHLICAHLYLLPHLRIHVHIGLLIEILAQSLPPLVLIVHEF